ncbi:hypothetical protein KR222_001850 [Zaprionus bogoriensis]|nr:hypothetical protein KR222_001850 [Zaprionus bogoriensis]
MSRSLSHQWALGVCLLLLCCAATPTRSRFIAKRETLAADMDMGADAFTADPDIVKSSSESSSAATTVRKPSLPLEELTTTTTTTFRPTTTTEEPKESSPQPVVEAAKTEEQLELKSNVQQQELNSQNALQSVHNSTLLGAVLEESVHNSTLLRAELEESELQSTTTVRAVKEASAKSEENELTTATTTTTTTTTTEAPAAVIAERMELERERTDATTTTTTTTTTERAASTQRSEDHARAMQFTSSTESAAFVASVTPMKLFALPMAAKTTTTITTTTTPQLLAALLHAGVTVSPSASHENDIIEQEEQLHPQPEKRAKFINDNSTNAQQLLLPNGAEVWSLAALKMVPTATTATTATTTTDATASSALDNDIEPLPHNQTEGGQQKEKNLLDWQQVMLMQENHTEALMSTALDATEAATQPTTLRLEPMLGERERAAVNSTAESNANMAITAGEPKQDEHAMAAVKAEPTESTTVEPVKLTDVDKFTLRNSEVTVTATEATTTTTTPASLPTAESELPATTTSTTTTTTTTTTAAPSALNGTPNANEMAMKAAATLGQGQGQAQAHEHNENGDKANDVDSDDVINVSVSVSVPTSETTTLAATERPPVTTVSTRTAGELSTTPETETQTQRQTETETESTPTPSLTLASTLTPTPQTVHAKLDEQLATTILSETTTTTTTTTTLRTPTPTETVQISNEVNLDTITVKNATKDNNEQTSVVNSLLTTETTTPTTTTTTTNTTTRTATATATEQSNNSETLQINNNSSTNNVTAATTTTTTTTPATVLLTDTKANSELSEHETSLETNNISELAAAATTTTTTEATAAAGAVNVLDESTATATTTRTTTTTTTTSTSSSAAASGPTEQYDDVDEDEQQQQIDRERDSVEQLLTKTKMADTTTSTSTTTTTTEATTTTTPAEQPIISLLDDSSTTTTTTTTTTTPAPTTRTTTPTAAAVTTPATRPIETTTTTTTLAPPTEPIYSSTNNNNNNMLPVESTTPRSGNAVDASTPFLMPHPTELDHMQQPTQGSAAGGGGGTDVNVIIAITVSVVGVVALILLVAFLYLMRKRQKQTSYGQRCRPVSLDAYSLDNVSVLGSVRRKGRDTRASKRTYGNAAFDDPSLRHNLLSATELGKFVERRSSIFEEFRDVPQIIARADEVPAGCEDKNRYANVIPLPETRVVLQRQGDDDKTEYINANYVRGPRDAPNYYIACQAPLESTTGDFWRMIWEQQSRVIVQATDLNENGIERCAEYLPPSVTLDNHSSYGDYQVTLKHREVKDKYAISTLMLKRVDGDECRELTHYWYKWPETGVPLEEAPIIAMLLEARSSLKSYALEQANELKEKSSTLTLKSLEPAMEAKAQEEAGSTSSGASTEINGNVTNNKAARSQQGPLTIHCSPGTGRTGTIITCDMAIRSLETPKRSVDIPQLVYYVRRGRASAVQTKEQYEFIYKVANMYATKITSLSNDN